MEFPVTNLYELEGRVFTEMWNIPFKKEESLGKCLIASTHLMDAGKLLDCIKTMGNVAFLISLIENYLNTSKHRCSVHFFNV